MPIDRAATLRQAEKLLQQGRLDAAIAAYASVVEDQPKDWSTANTLGDLYLRAGQPDRAAQQFVRSADQLSAEGFAAKAAALYKKVLKLKPDDEHALVQAGQIAAGQGLFADARAHFTIVAERRAARGDARGATDMRIRIGTLDPADFARRIEAARERALIDDVAGAVRDLKAIGRDLVDGRRTGEAITALAEAARLAPDDAVLRSQLLALHVEAGDVARAREYAKSGDDFRTLAQAMERQGRHDDALDALRDAVHVAPGDRALTLHLARAFLARGDGEAAAEFLTPDIARSDPQLLIAAAELAFRSGQHDRGTEYVQRFLAEDSEGRERVALLTSNLTDDSPDVAALVLDVAVDNAVSCSDWSWAVAALQEFIRRVPYHVPALLRLVEVCVDGGLESALYEAQGKLADAYLAAGSAAEARAIAEGLLEHDPSDPLHVDRLRRALTRLGEPDVEAVVAERLHASAHREESTGEQIVEPFDEIAADSMVVATDQADSVDEDVEELPDLNQLLSAHAVARPPAHPRNEDPNFALGPNAIDIDSILQDFTIEDADEEPVRVRPAAKAVAEPEQRSDADADEVDLSGALNQIKPPAINAADLDAVFQHLRDEAALRSPTAAGDASYHRALALKQSGDIDGCIASLEEAFRVPEHAFAAASELGRLLKQRGHVAEAIEWLERAAEVAPSSARASFDVLYELADGLEDIGESERALAVWLELHADAGPYRDVAARIERLTDTRARG